MEQPYSSTLDLFNQFKAPHRDTYPAVYWFWHHIPSRVEIETQLEQISASGFKTFLIQARLALPLKDFLSEAYLNAYRYALELAKQKGLIGGLYDDYNWQSGHAGGRTVSGSNELKERQMFWSSRVVDGRNLLCSVSDIHSLLVEELGEVGMNWCYEKGVIQWDDWSIFKVLVYPDMIDLDSDMLVDISVHSDFEKTGPDGYMVRVNLPASIPIGWRVTAFVVGRCVTSRSMNYLLPEATQKFIQVAYEPFAEKMNDLLGDPLAFAFYDHPHAAFYSWEQLEGNVLNSLMFTEALVEVFESEHNYPMEWALLALIRPLSDLTAKFRCDFFDTYGQMARESFFGPLARWTWAHGMGLAGHELLSYIGQWGFMGGFENADHRTNFGGDYFAVDRYRTISTVDACDNNPQIDAKMGDSVAKAHGRRGCMIEQYYGSKTEGVPYPAGQWELTLDDYRTQAIRHYLLGARQFIYHGFYLSEGCADDFSMFTNPRFDFAPGVNLEPWFPFHAGFSAEMARLVTFMFSGDVPASMGLLYPLRTYWAEGPEHAFVTESAFWNQLLVESGINFDILDEQQLVKAQIVDGGFETEYRKYTALILPGVSTLQSNHTYEKILALVQKKGLLIASGQVPSATQESGYASDLENRFRKMFESYENAFYFPREKDPVEIQDWLSSYLKSDEENSFQVSFLKIPGPHVWSWQGVNPFGTLVVLFNDSVEVEYLAFSVPNQATPERWNPTQGTKVSWAWFNRNTNHTEVYLLLNPKEVTCFLLKPGDSKLQSHLIESSIPALHASNQEDLELIFEDDEGGQTLTALIYSPLEPTVTNDSITGEICFFGDNVWRIRGQSPILPQPLVLENGWTFYTGKDISKKEIDIQRGWELQGYADYSGMGTYECDFFLDVEYFVCDLDLVFPQLETAVEVYINDELVGKRGWLPYQFSIPKSKISLGKNHLQVNVYNTGGNHYYQNTPYTGDSPTPSGIIGAPWIKPLQRIIITTQIQRR